MVDSGCKVFKEKRVDCVILKWALRKQDMTSVPDNLQPEHACNICDSDFLSKAGLACLRTESNPKQTTVKAIQNDLEEIYVSFLANYVGQQQV